MRLALCQMNATVGDIAGNAERIADWIACARGAGAELALLPELALTGYPPEDLLLREHFLSDAAAALRTLASKVHGIVAVVGFPERAADVYNAAAVLADGRVHAIYRKVYLPNYGVFDEQRYFQAGDGGAVIDISGERVGITVCEDMWAPGPPASDEAIAGATLLANISASPYHASKGGDREAMFAQRARENVAAVAFCGLVGGQDELVFDGRSCVIDHTGRTLARAVQFEEELLLCDVDLGAAAGARLRDATQRPAARRASGRARVLAPVELGGAGGAGTAGGDGGAAFEVGALREPIASAEAEVYAALRLGLRDYVRKNGFSHVLFGLSGGIDSALVACVAADALGPDAVTAVVMPSIHSSHGTQADARALAGNLGVACEELPIAPVMDAYEATLTQQLGGRPPGLTEENLQARIRGNLLMALSNENGWLVLTTGNKSEMSVGYTTLYGDLAGGFAVIKDVPKTLVYRLCAWRNSPEGTASARGADGGRADGGRADGGRADGGRADGGVSAPIPQSIIERAPSAELRPDQRDEDSLPPYSLLDEILHGYIELDRSREQLIADGLPAEAVELATRLVDLAEYKRRQAPPGIKVTTRAFGRDRRMPITNRYRG